MEQLNMLVEKLSKVLLVIGGIAIILMMLHISIDVASKYLLGHSINGTLEIVAWYYMISCVFLPLAYVQARRQNLTVELFTGGLPDRAKSLIDGIVALASIAYTGLLTSLVFQRAVKSTVEWEIQDVTYFDMPVWPVRWILPLSFGLMSLVFLLQGIQDLRFAITGRGRPSFDETQKSSLQV